MLSRCFNWEQQSPYPRLDCGEHCEFRHGQVTKFQTYIERKRRVEEAWHAYNIKLAHCYDLETEVGTSLVDKTEECDGLQRTMQEHACRHSGSNREGRKRFGQRWAQLLADYTMAREEKDILQMDRIAEWETLHIVKCLLTNVHSAVQNSIDTGAPCPTEVSDPERVNATIEECHIVTRGCPHAWDHPNDRVSLHDMPESWPVVTGGTADCSIEQQTFGREGSTYGVVTIPMFSCSITAHLCLEWCPIPCNTTYGDLTHVRNAVHADDERCLPPPPEPPVCSTTYVERETGSFLPDIQTLHSANLVDQFHYDAEDCAHFGLPSPCALEHDPVNANDPLTAHLTGLSAWGWAGCAPPLMCEECEGMEPAPVDHEYSAPARDCQVHELYLAPGHSDFDTFRCHDDGCISVSGRCNGIPQCADNSDEVGCDSGDVGLPTICPDDFGRVFSDLASDAGCGSEHDSDVHFQCDGGKFVDRAALCNEFPNCEDETDEAQCTGALSLHVSVEAMSGRTISVETLSRHTAVFHDRQYTFDSLGSFEGKTFVKYSNDDKWTDRHHVMTRIRTSAPTTVYIVRAPGTAQWALDFGFTPDQSLNGVSFRGFRTINRVGPASEWEETRHKEWDPTINTEEPIHLTEVLSKTFPAGTINIPGNDGHDGSFLIFMDKHEINSPAPAPAPAPAVCALQAYWEYGGCGCGGNDQNANWCGGIGSGNCPQTVQTNVCPSGTAHLAEWHPKPYGGSGHQGEGTPGHLVRDGCEYIWHAQYACTEPLD